MSKAAAFLFLMALLLVSCDKEYLVPERELPQWLKDNIEMLEQNIADNPKSMAKISAWMRTEWKHEYYYEYYNPLLSSMPRPISHSGDTLDVWIGDMDSDYFKEKCCSVYVWKGPDYKEYIR